MLRAVLARISHTFPAASRDITPTLCGLALLLFNAPTLQNDARAVTIDDAGISLDGPATILNGQEAMYVVTISGNGADSSDETELLFTVVDDVTGHQDDVILVDRQAFFVIGEGTDGSFTNTEVFVLSCNARYELAGTNGVSSREKGTNDTAGVFVRIEEKSGAIKGASHSMPITCLPNRQQKELIDAIAKLQECINETVAAKYRKRFLVPVQDIAQKALDELMKEPPNNHAALKGVKNLATKLREAESESPAHAEACQFESLMRGLLFRVSRTLAWDAINEGVSSGCKECKINSANTLLLQGIKYTKSGKSFAAADCFLKAFTRVK